MTPPCWTRRTGLPASLPGPAPQENDKFPPNKPYREIPIAIQDRSFNSDGSLFYPDTRAFFDGVAGPYIPDTDLSPIWNPEFFGNTIIVNGNTWPFLNVEQRRYRFRVLNGCQSRFLILDFNQIPGVEVWAIGNEGGFLADPGQPHRRQRQPVADGPRRAGRPDRRLHQRAASATTCSPTSDPTNRSVAANRTRTSTSPTRPRPARSCSSGVVPALTVDASTPPQFLQLPAITPLPAETVTRPLALLEEASAFFDDAPAEALLGTVAGDPNVAPGVWTKRLWADPVTENPAVGATEVWELYNATADAHPMHIHETTFEVLNRQDIHHRRGRPDGAGRARIGRRPRRSRGRPGSKTPSSPTPAKSPGSAPSSTCPASTCGTATSSNTKTTR